MSSRLNKGLRFVITRPERQQMGREDAVPEKARRTMGTHRLRCNLCQETFRAASQFYRFCRTCRTQDEIFRFADWLPPQEL